MICRYGNYISDLLIVDLCNQNENNFSNLHNYQTPEELGFENKDKKSFLAGGNKFRVLELEFFKVHFN